MDKYTLMKRFIYERWFQVYMYASMYVDPDTMAEGD